MGDEAATTERYDPRVAALCVHPGEIIRDEMEARGCTVETLAERASLNLVTVQRLLNGERDVDSGIAYALSEAFGVDPRFFIALQHSYDAWREAQERGDG